MGHDIADRSLHAAGLLRIEWAEREMPVLRGIRERFLREQPLKGMRIGACLHVTTETANLMRTLQAGGARVALCGSNPLSTQDDVAAALAKHFRLPVFAIHGEDRDTYYQHIHAVLNARPTMTMDDGCDLVSTLHAERTDLLPGVVAGSEETTTGVIRLRAMAEDGALRYPIIAVNDADTKHLFDNRYGTGQSTIDGIIRATNVLLAGKVFVVCGYGWCARGVAMRARGHGAHVVVTEVDPLRALEAAMDGYQVMPIAQAAKRGDVFCTLTGDIHVIRKEHFAAMKDGAILCNSGHFDVELDLVALRKMSSEVRDLRAGLQEYALKASTRGKRGPAKRLYVLGEGRLVNLAVAEGHPASVMDMSFANQALVAEFVAKRGRSLEVGVIEVPKEIDRQVARLKLRAMGLKIDRLTAEQETYLSSWQAGT